MATMRRGLPRTAGGDPWPPEGAAPDAAVDEPVAAEPPAEPPTPDVPTADTAPGTEPALAADAAPAETAPAPAAEARDLPAPATLGAGRLRRGLPRVAGGDPWPPSGTVPASAAAGSTATTGAAAPSAAAVDAEAPAVPRPEAASVSAVAAPSAAPAALPEGAVLRRGLPRVDGGEPWPPAGTAAARAHAASQAEPADAAETPAAAAPVAASGAPASSVPDVSVPLPFRRTAWHGTAPRDPVPAEEPHGRRRPTWPQVLAGLLGAAGLALLAGAAVVFVRALLSMPFMQDFLAAFPGEYEPGIPVEPGFAPWIGWQHFFNMFLMVLIIRSGLRVRTEKRPTAFWSPRNDPKGKISLTLWLHQALDVLWLVNGVIFVVLLIVTGHWVRIVPTSWEVFPNALSSALQYVSLDWPHENGWNNYNALQQLAYFATVFLAAPLAAITGFRMSGMWPKKAEGLSKAYPVEWARAVHFPVMLYFVGFIVVHVALVLLTGMLRNLNHMFASQDAVTWTGFWVFLASLVVIAIGWFAARPLVVAPVAKVFGSVSGR